uniref:Urea ABC transporter ATP-binding protein UrtD n=1 Tax=OCS116 cluster bacterium TaxID=2030921 RepID=A0A2A4ZA07_9PROT
MTHTKDLVLYMDGVNVAFDGFKAINNLSMVIEQGEMRAIIGPNGAGKTTMMDIITGKTRPDSGQVFYNGDTDLLKLDEAEIAQLGIGRKFQKPTVFEGQTVYANVELALAMSRTVFSSLFWLSTTKQEKQVEAILDRVRLSHLRNQMSANLSHGQKQWLEIAMLLAQNPKLLLVDEPVAGMTDSETEETAKLLKDIAQDHSLIVVEHDMDFVRELNVRVTVLHEGSVLTSGSIDHVSANQQVIDVYLGR